MKKFAAILISAMLLCACTPQDAMDAAQSTAAPTQSPAKQTTEEKMMYETSDRICVNQIGYKKDGDKRFWCLDEMQTFNVVREDTQEVVFSGGANEISPDSAIGGIATWYGDFTELNAPGEIFYCGGRQKIIYI